MGNKNIYIGVIGCGHLGSIHAKILNDLCSINNDISFSGVFDIIKERAEKISSEYKVKSYDTCEQLLDNINTLIIAATTSSHFEIAKQALEKNINLFIEKPVTVNGTEAHELIELSKNKKVKIQVGHVERFNPALTSLSKYELKPLFIESHRLAQFNPRGTDVSVIQDLMIHDIDIVFSMVKSPLINIDANGVAVISDNIDIANARLSFENGCVANLTASRISLKKMRKMRIFQQKAYISVDFSENKSELFHLVDSDFPAAKGVTVYPFSDKKKILYELPEPEANDINPIKEELESFFTSVTENKSVKVTLEEASRAVETADKIIEIISNSLKKIKIS
jgi:predicted dehydrogenase